MVIPGNIPLFEGLSSDETATLLTCIGGSWLSAKKGEILLHEGQEIDSLGVVIAGSVQILRSDGEGNRVILAAFGPGAVFAESFVCAGEKKSPVTVQAMEMSRILYIPCSRLLRPCAKACAFHHRVIENLMRLMARKNLVLNARLEILSARTIRQRLLALLDFERRKQGSKTLSLPWNRTELADYLCTDRSALSRELSRMKDEGVLDFEGASFVLK
ncbi:Crp/Fnr family transcriptional regulator [Treponema zuelzerae]|uniref:Crp/Fnr family transcriptional regulator n=1 Tax=Teretinema zuelzerae TaxID=156 RepID=A0AAE3EK26_9SPIR|nr:Crp/Fnr family transcriptional regulator [Teretinema zuelzerae]MCD1655897.1 Crp/Fnr family transcriptional regulator [Teretinema zuelzerae]